jgi:hypothetical protein
LLRWIQYETPAWRKGLSDLAKKLGLHVPFLSAENVELYRAESAIMGFRCLGSDAEGAIPELLELTRAKYSMTQVRAGRALGSIGGESVPALLSMLTNRPALQGNDVAPLYWGWQCLGSDAILGVPVLVDQLKCTNGMVAGTSATLLGIGHVDGDVVVPALTNAVSRRDPWVRICALQGLCAFVEYEDVVTPVLVRALSDSDPNVRAFATNELRSFARPMVGGSGK